MVWVFGRSLLPFGRAKLRPTGWVMDLHALVTGYTALHTGCGSWLRPTALPMGMNLHGLRPVDMTYLGIRSRSLGGVHITSGYSHGPLRGLHTYVHTCRVFASQTPFKMRAPLGVRRTPHSAWIRTGALDLRSSTPVSTGDSLRLSAPIARCTYVRHVRRVCQSELACLG